MDIHMIAGNSMDQGYLHDRQHQRGSWWQKRPLTSTWPSASAQIPSQPLMTEWAQVVVQATYINMAPSGSMAHGHQHDFTQQQRSQGLPSVITKTMDIYMDPHLQ